jgi:hypothetical protein
MPSNFNELSKDARYWKMILKCLARNGKPPWFRSREKNVAEYNDDNPTTYKENVNRKGKADNCHAEFEGKETSSKGATSL